MSEKIYSDTTDKFLCDILSKKCSDFLSTYSNTFNPIPTSSQFYEINPLTLSQSLKNEKLKAQKLPVLPKNMTPYERMRSNKSPGTKKQREQKDQEVRDKEEQLLVELMKKIIDNLKTNLSKLLNRLEGFPNKEAFKSIVYTLQDQFQLVNMELERVCKYTKKKQIRDIFMFQICSIHPPDFVELVFENLPVLREYFTKFQLPTLTNQQIQQLKQGSSLIYYLTEFNGLLQQRARQKKIKKRQNKKKNKQLKNEGLEKTEEEVKAIEVAMVEETNQNKIAEFLSSMVISEERMSCNASDDWMEMLKMRYVC